MDILPTFALTYAEQRQVVDRAREEVFKRVLYDPSYQKIKYPDGDIDPSRGVCTDLVVRALRAIDLDLQKEIYEDRKRCPKAYGKGRPDPNIDHRRCRNQMIWMKRHAEALTLETDSDKLKQWQPGDLVYWDLNGKGLLHVGVISNMKKMDGMPLVIHNVGFYPTEAPVLLEWKIIGHFRADSPGNLPEQG
ncbi:MAG: hypothetical protein A2Z18_07115 [Armatimonadetes bacterium RBG_16_58_9]|nr:MAG: hypothetical protein A2Z18_07115 [Armatimonadetes bacterium RBG_16_58_9]